MKKPFRSVAAVGQVFAAARQWVRHRAGARKANASPVSALDPEVRRQVAEIGAMLKAQQHFAITSVQAAMCVPTLEESNPVLPRQVPSAEGR